MPSLIENLNPPSHVVTYHEKEEEGGKGKEGK